MYNHFEVLKRLTITLFVIGTCFAQEQEVLGAPRPVLHHSPAEKRELTGVTLMDGISVGVLLEVEASVGKAAGDNVSDITLATFELDIDADLNACVKGHALLLWEEDGTEPIDLDEATITIGDTDTIPAYVTVGKMYVPFGTFNSHFISDPLVLELGEARESALLVGYGNTAFKLQAAVFNGDIDDGEDRTDNAIASAKIMPLSGVEIGGFWISDIGESDGLQELIGERMIATDGVVYDDVPGAGAFLSLSAKKLVFDAEYISATENFSPLLLGENALRPFAWNAELAFHSGARWEAAVKVERSCDFPGFPDSQCGAVASIAIGESAALAAEYLFGKYDGEAEDRHLGTCQLSLEF